MLRSSFEISRNWTILLCSSATKRSLRDQEGTRIKRWIQSNVRFGRVSVIKVCNHYGRYSIEVQVQSLLQDQTVSWIRIVNGIDKFVREAMPIQVEEKALGKPAAKTRPVLKPSSTSDVNFIPVGQRKWIDIETQESNDPHRSQVPKLATRVLHQCQEVYREVDFFVLETIRTSAMRVIHVIVKTEETQKLRIKFVLD